MSEKSLKSNRIFCQKDPAEENHGGETNKVGISIFVLTSISVLVIFLFFLLHHTSPESKKKNVLHDIGENCETDQIFE